MPILCRILADGLIGPPFSRVPVFRFGGSQLSMPGTGLMQGQSQRSRASPVMKETYRRLLQREFHSYCPIHRGPGPMLFAALWWLAVSCSQGGGFPPAAFFGGSFWTWDFLGTRQNEISSIDSSDLRCFLERYRCCGCSVGQARGQVTPRQPDPTDPRRGETWPLSLSRHGTAITPTPVDPCALTRQAGAPSPAARYQTFRRLWPESPR